VVIDSRAGRVLDPGGRMMVDGGEWRWIAEQATGDRDHLLLASSVPFVLTPGLHHLEEWIEIAATSMPSVEANSAATMPAEPIPTITRS